MASVFSIEIPNLGCSILSGWLTVTTIGYLFAINYPGNEYPYPFFVCLDTERCFDFLQVLRQLFRAAIKVNFSFHDNHMSIA